MHYGLPDPISKLIKSLSKLPGIGEKNATRLAFHLVRSPRELAESIAEAIIDAKTRVSTCPNCFSFMAGDNCSICTDHKRDKSVICVVAEPFDLVAIEKSREHRGTYHVLNGVISPIEGVGPDDLKIKELIKRLKTEPITEVIIATNPSVEGEATALYLAKIIKPLGIAVTRLAHGIPVGGDIGYVDELTLGKALKDRRSI